jgi:hypothetical protein
MDSVYRDIVKQNQTKIQDQPISVKTMIPLDIKENILYPNRGTDLTIKKIITRQLGTLEVQEVRPTTIGAT